MQVHTLRRSLCAPVNRAQQPHHNKARLKLYEYEIRALIPWQEQIEKGVKPSFDFGAP